MDDTATDLLRIDGAGCDVRIVGEVDFTTAHRLRHALERAEQGDGDVHLDLSELRFIDVAGATELLHTAGRLGPGRQLVLHGTPRLLRFIITTLWGSTDTIKMDTP